MRVFLGKISNLLNHFVLKYVFGKLALAKAAAFYLSFALVSHVFSLMFVNNPSTLSFLAFDNYFLENKWLTQHLPQNEFGIGRNQGNLAQHVFTENIWNPEVKDYFQVSYTSFYESNDHLFHKLKESGHVGSMSQEEFYKVYYNINFLKFVPFLTFIVVGTVWGIIRIRTFKYWTTWGAGLNFINYTSYLCLIFIVAVLPTDYFSLILRDISISISNGYLNDIRHGVFGTDDLKNLLVRKSINNNEYFLLLFVFAYLLVGGFHSIVDWQNPNKEGWKDN